MKVNDYIKMNINKGTEQEKAQIFTMKKLVKETQNNITKTIRKVCKLKHEIKIENYLIKKIYVEEIR